MAKVEQLHRFHNINWMATLWCYSNTFILAVLGTTRTTQSPVDSGRENYLRLLDVFVFCLVVFAFPSVSICALFFPVYSAEILTYSPAHIYMLSPSNCTLTVTIYRIQFGFTSPFPRKSNRKTQIQTTGEAPPQSIFIGPCGVVWGYIRLDVLVLSSWRAMRTTYVRRTISLTSLCHTHPSCLLFLRFLLRHPR